MTRRTASTTVVLATLFATVLFLSGAALAQSPGLSPEVLNRPLLPCSSPPGVDSNIHGILWPGGKVPYVFDANVTAAQQAGERPRHMRANDLATGGIGQLITQEADLRFPGGLGGERSTLLPNGQRGGLGERCQA